MHNYNSQRKEEPIKGPLWFWRWGGRHNMGSSAPPLWWSEKQNCWFILSTSGTNQLVQVQLFLLKLLLLKYHQVKKKTNRRNIIAFRSTADPLFHSRDLKVIRRCFVGALLLRILGWYFRKERMQTSNLPTLASFFQQGKMQLTHGLHIPQVELSACQAYPVCWCLTVNGLLSLRLGSETPRMWRAESAP